MEEVFACNDISTDEDYPDGIKNLINKWTKGEVNNLKIGDKVKLKYLMNIKINGIYKLTKFQNQIGTIKKMNILDEKQFSKRKWLDIEWDNQELNKSYYPWMPYQFIKLK